MDNGSDNSTYNRKRYLFDEYFDYHKHYIGLYGPRTVVFFEVGSFYCMYGVNNENTKMNENIIKITEILHITLTRVDKSIIENSRQNPLMCGIPNHEHILNKYMRILVQEYDYTVVKINQKADRAGKMCRTVSKIYSPSTYIEDDEQVESNCLMGIYFDSCGPVSWYGSFCTIDLSSGNIMIYEPKNSDGSFIDEIYRFRRSYRPKEYLINYNPGLVPKDKPNEILNYLDLTEFEGTTHLRELPRKNIVWELNYQNEFLLKVYPKHQFLSPIEYIDLEKNPVSVVNLIRTIEFAYEHDDRIIQRLNKPTVIDQNKHLVLETKSIDQLNLISDRNDGKLSSVLNLIDHTKTIPGRRKLKAQLISPIIDHTILKNRYNLIETIINNEQLAETLSYELSQIVDLERRHRKMTIGILNPAEFYRLTTSYNSVLKIIETIKPHNGVGDLCPEDDPVIDKFKQFMQEYITKFDLTEIQRFYLDSIKGSFLKPGVDSKVDNYHKRIQKIHEAMNARRKELSNLVGDTKNPDAVTLEYNTIHGYHFKITKTRYNKLKDQLSMYSVKKNTNEYRLFSPKLKEISGKLTILETKLERQIKKIYIDLIKGWAITFGSILQTITDFISTIDIIQSHAYTAKKYGYIKPLIVDQKEEAFVSAKALRNCLAERINTQVKFVPNDINLGPQATNGMLLFSVNGCGKSTLLRSVATSLILAQAGCYVPASEFKFSPFKNILTRIGNQDNIFKNQSTFQIEMLELRTILNRADTKSLVITDELCSGTENSSATAIMAATIIKLAQKRVNFMFATHLHNLNQITEISELKNVKTYHLKVEPHPVTGDLIYNRKLSDGPGDSIYGLEIAKYILNNQDFIKTAMCIRKELLGLSTEILADKKSRYNKRVFTHQCEICKLKEDLETHHIQFQCTAIGKKIDEGTVSIHHQANLVVLCSQCHLNVHKGNINIKGWKESIESGKFLDYHHSI